MELIFIMDYYVFSIKKLREILVRKLTGFFTRLISNFLGILCLFSRLNYSYLRAWLDNFVLYKWSSSRKSNVEQRNIFNYLGDCYFHIPFCDFHSNTNTAPIKSSSSSYNKNKFTLKQWPLKRNVVFTTAWEKSDGV